MCQGIGLGLNKPKLRLDSKTSNLLKTSHSEQRVDQRCPYKLTI
jgi:hypothetical protein